MVKTGIPTLVGVARLVCKTITALRPLILKATDNNPAVLAALAAAQAACSTLDEVLTPFLGTGV